ncbi:TonB-dependent receptor [Ferruginibacter sp. HRS2-29]|uniref:TonB-dependent receptor n=1 Tax=Ferruginibacter sp. HRS2-29 TaxID=2487334 RepID=UPI0020CDC2FF|nr:TonB-dependent receptor [Ferruginibacter sp. HRS2-29]MCP9753109.1 TonB-dependent receptor [Ferruginibacter sp. HRS2-29]
MYKIYSFVAILLFSTLMAGAQKTIRFTITAKESGAGVAGATVQLKGTAQSAVADSNGVATFQDIIPAELTAEITALGFEEVNVKITLKELEKGTIEIRLTGSEEEEMEEVVVQSTRTSRTIANVPTRVEAISLEEIDEKSNMRPANVAMILHESTGIQMQQTSATSANASVRIQGLDGRYTQLLKDGFPNFGNFSSGLSVLEIPPLDLKQVEIIKGPASPLYGGGAIAGVINFVSKTPKDKPEYNFLLNYSNIGQANVGAFLSAKKNKFGYTLLALYNHQKLYDVDKDDFTEVPESDEFTIHPKLFFYPNDKTTIQIGNSFTKGKRTGGDVEAIKNNTSADHRYFEKNNTLRNITTLQLDKKLAEGKSLVAKQSISYFDRDIIVPGYQFGGNELNAFTDVSYVANAKKHSLVVGANFLYNQFREDTSSFQKRNYTTTTGGAYAQHTWDASEKIKLETGLRADLVNYKNDIYSKTTFFLLPRVSLLIKYNDHLSSRIGGGMGYKAPSLFTEQTETIQYSGVQQLNNVIAEQSYGGTADIDYRTRFGDDFSFSFNHLFFYTNIRKPLVLTASPGMPDQYFFQNASKPVNTLGFETNAKLVYKRFFKLFLGYTFTDTKAKYLAGNQFLPLVPRGKLNTALIYEKEGFLKLGLEGYFTGRQYLTNGYRTPSFSEFGFMAEKVFSKISVYVNFENFTDTRQSKYKNVVNGSHTAPTFDEIWNHTEGFVFNGGIKIRL